MKSQAYKSVTNEIWAYEQAYKSVTMQKSWNNLQIWVYERPAFAPSVANHGKIYHLL